MTDNKETNISNFVTFLCSEIKDKSGIVPQFLISRYWKEQYPENTFPFNGSQVISDRIKRIYPTITGEPVHIINSTAGDFLVRSKEDPNIKAQVSNIATKKIQANIQTRANNIKLKINT